MINLVVLKLLQTQYLPPQVDLEHARLGLGRDPILGTPVNKQRLTGKNVCRGVYWRRALMLKRIALSHAKSFAASYLPRCYFSIFVHSFRCTRPESWNNGCLYTNEKFQGKLWNIEGHPTIRYIEGMQQSRRACCPSSLPPGLLGLSIVSGLREICIVGGTSYTTDLIVFTNSGLVVHFYSNRRHVSKGVRTSNL